MSDANPSEAGLWGVLVGDALGVPYEFQSANQLPTRPAIDLPVPPGFRRTYPDVPDGWWSDDGAQALALLHTLRSGFTPTTFADELAAWLREGRYMPEAGPPFDCGISTRDALNAYAQSRDANTCGKTDERSNGNGSLMRCIAIATHGAQNDFEAVQQAHAQSMVTHAHVRSQVSCAYYVLWARAVIRQEQTAAKAASSQLMALYEQHDLVAHVRELRDEVKPLAPLEREPAGYVVDSLRAAVIANEQPSYEDVVRSAIAFGKDTDTNAAIAGGIAGLRFGIQGIPRRWLIQVARLAPFGLTPLG